MKTIKGKMLGGACSKQGGVVIKTTGLGLKNGPNRVDSWVTRAGQFNGSEQWASI